MHVKTLDKDVYERLLSDAHVLERDDFGDKVLRLQNGPYLKLFRIKRRFSLKRIMPESQLFARHAQALKKRGIPTVTVRECVTIPHLKRTGVIYAPLNGRTIRQAAAADETDRSMFYRLGGFIAGLHSKGIYFRSLHLGNILLCPDGSFGLIDISDMRIFPFPLPAAFCIHNFRHLLRCGQDCKILSNGGIENLLDGYEECRPISRNRMALNQRIYRLMANSDPNL